MIAGPRISVLERGGNYGDQKELEEASTEQQIFFSLTKQERQSAPMDTKWSPRGHGSATPGSVVNLYFKSINSNYKWQE